jgi:anti-sigma regulatory factor (Ser/Thr protein kinase)
MSSQMTLELPRDEQAPGRARAALSAFVGALPEERFDVARLLMSELVTNAVKYGADGSVRIEAAAAPGRLRAEVIDEGHGFVPEPGEPELREAEGGWGLPLVERLADRWGAYVGSTHVWFEIEAGPLVSSRR